MTLETIIQILLAIIGIMILFYALQRLLPLGCLEAPQEQAKGQILEFEKFLKGLNPGQTSTFTLLSPKGWWLISFNESDNTSPAIYFKYNVTCICNTYSCKGTIACIKLGKPIYEEMKNLKIEIGIKDVNVTNKDNFYELNQTKPNA